MIFNNPSRVMKRAIMVANGLGKAIGPLPGDRAPYSAAINPMGFAAGGNIESTNGTVNRALQVARGHYDDGGNVIAENIAKQTIASNPFEYKTWNAQLDAVFHKAVKVLGAETIKRMSKQQINFLYKALGTVLKHHNGQTDSVTPAEIEEQYKQIMPHILPTGSTAMGHR